MSSLYLLIGILVFFVLAVIITNTLYKRKNNHQGEAPETDCTPTANQVNTECCGMHEVCERDSLIAAFTATPEYFDDEELDRFQHRTSDSYSNKETDEFRDVFYSVLDDEKPKWIRSLQVRGIELPDEMKDEVLMIVNELRDNKMAHSH